MRGDQTRRLVRPKMLNIAPGNLIAVIKKGYDIVQPKYDGIWGRLELHEDGWEIYSRTGNLKAAGLGEFQPAVLHGEFMFGSQWSKHPDRQGKVYLFDAEMVQGVDIREKNYAYRLRAVESLADSLPDAMREQWVVVETRPVPQTQTELDALWLHWIDDHELEGLMFKWSDADWATQQLHGFGRMKESKTIDYVCMGFKPGGHGTKYEHLVASVRGGLYINRELKFVANVGGLNESQREEFASNPTHYIGRVFEASGKKIFRSGALRHPSFERWREDKPAFDCVLP